LADAERISLSLPEAVEGTSYGNRAWKVKGKTFAWERPLGKKDEAELGDRAPDGDILGVRVPDELVKEILCENEGPAVFVTTHFDGFDAVLIDLKKVDPELLEDLITDSWRTMAPAKLAAGLDDA
jgi:hypothetical protein